MEDQNKIVKEKIVGELKRSSIKSVEKLLERMCVENTMVRDSKENNFFWVWSSSHDHWTGGTAQHSWRVYEYMRRMWENPCGVYDSRLSSDWHKNISLKEIILAGLLHDLGKMRGNNHHASSSKNILLEIYGTEFEKAYPKVMDAIRFHHRTKEHVGTDLRFLLNKADNMAAGTAWHYNRFIEKRSQRTGKHTNDICHMRRVAMDRTNQMLRYGMYLDYDFNLQIVSSYKGVLQGYTDIPEINSGQKLSCDYITYAHNKNSNGKLCLVIGIENDVIVGKERYLRQNNPQEESFLICSNALHYFYSSESIRDHRYSYTIKDNYSKHLSDKCIYMKDVTIIRDGESMGFRQVKPWKVDVLLVPGKKCTVIANAEEINDKLLSIPPQRLL